MVLIDSTVYVFGGINSKGEKLTDLRAFNIYSAIAGQLQWTTPTTTAAATACLLLSNSSEERAGGAACWAEEEEGGKGGGVADRNGTGLTVPQGSEGKANINVRIKALGLSRLRTLARARVQDRALVDWMQVSPQTLRTLGPFAV